MPDLFSNSGGSRWRLDNCVDADRRRIVLSAKSQLNLGFKLKPTNTCFKYSLNWNTCPFRLKTPKC